MNSKLRNVAKAGLQQRVSAEEWDARVNLAACYRLAAHYRMTDLIYTHISARLPVADRRDGGRRKAQHASARGRRKSRQPVQRASVQGEEHRMEGAPADARQDGRVLPDVTRKYA